MSATFCVFFFSFSMCLPFYFAFSLFIVAVQHNTTHNYWKAIFLYFQFPFLLYIIIRFYWSNIWSIEKGVFLKNYCFKYRDMTNFLWFYVLFVILHTSSNVCIYVFKSSLKCTVALTSLLTHSYIYPFYLSIDRSSFHFFFFYFPTSPHIWLSL